MKAKDIADVAAKMLDDEDIRRKVVAAAAHFMRSEKHGSIKGAIDLFLSKYRDEQIGSIRRTMDDWMDSYIHTRLKTEKKRLYDTVDKYLDQNLWVLVHGAIERAVGKAIENEVGRIGDAIKQHIEEQFRDKRFTVSVDEALDKYDKHRDY